MCHPATVVLDLPTHTFISTQTVALYLPLSRNLSAALWNLSGTKKHKKNCRSKATIHAEKFSFLCEVLLTRKMFQLFIVPAFTFRNMVMNQDEKTAFVEKLFTQQMHKEYKWGKLLHVYSAFAYYLTNREHCYNTISRLFLDVNSYMVET